MWLIVHRVGTAAFVVVVVAQAVIAGQHVFGDWGIGVHGVLGNLAFTLVVITAISAFMAHRGPVARILGIVLVVAVTAQIGLGYASRETEGAAAWHIPLGVVVFGLGVYQAVLAWPALVDRES